MTKPHPAVIPVQLEITVGIVHNITLLYSCICDTAVVIWSALYICQKQEKHHRGGVLSDLWYTT